MEICFAVYFEKGVRKALEKKRSRKKKLLRLFLIISFAVIMGFALRFLYLYLLDYTTADFDEKGEGYELTQPEFLQSQYQVPVKEEEQKIDDGLWINGEYPDTPKSALMMRLAVKNKAVLNSDRPVFHMVNIDEKQTDYQLIADLSSVRNIKSVSFAVWGKENGQTDLHLYEGTYDPDTRTWQSDVSVKNHKECGDYETKIIVKKNSGKVENLDFGAFSVSRPSITAALDGARVDKGQFEVTLNVDSVADAETVSVPIWSKEDQSDIRWYEAQKQEDGTYKAHMDYEDFNFTNGIYTAHAYFTGANGLTAEAIAGTAEINMTHPVRIRVLGDTPLFQDRGLTNVVKHLNANSMSYIKGIVYNGDQKVYKTTEGYISAVNLSVNEMTQDLRYVAHRGNHYQAPENSLPAFQQTNTWGVETDIHATKDGHWIVMHDADVDRMTNGSGKIKDLTLEEIRKFKIDAGTNAGAYSGSQLVVPTLEEYLAIMQNNQAVPLIEVKPKSVSAKEFDTLAALISKYGLSETAFVISFEYNNLVEMKKRMPNLHVQLLSDNINEGLISQAKSLGSNAGLDVDYNYAKSKLDIIVKAQAEGLSVNLWNVPSSDFAKAKSFGIDFLTSDPS